MKNVCGLQQFFQKGFTNLEKKITGFFLFLVVRKEATEDAMSAEVKSCDESVTTLGLALFPFTVQNNDRQPHVYMGYTDYSVARSSF